MLAATVRRVLPLAEAEDVLVVTGEVIAAEVARALPEVPASGVLAEPVGRNTAPCVGWAALHVRRRDPEGVMVVLPADHAIGDEPAFLEVIRRAVSACEGGRMATIGVTPTRPETGFGYIEVGAEVAPGIHEVARFVEKPDLATAERYLAGGRHAWNSGTFFFTAQTILAEIERQMPDLWAGLMEIDRALGTADEARVVAEVYGRIRGESIDYGVMEGARDIAVCPGSFGWNDVGSWAAAYEMRASGADEAGNVALAELVSVDATGCMAWTEPRKLVALVGLRDVVVVDTEDALLVCPRDRAQDVKAVVEALKARGRSELL